MPVVFGLKMRNRTRNYRILRAIEQKPLYPDELWFAAYGYNEDRWPVTEGALRSLICNLNKRLATVGLRLATGGRGSRNKPKPYRMYLAANKRPGGLARASNVISTGGEVVG